MLRPVGRTTRRRQLALVVAGALLAVAAGGGSPSAATGDSWRRVASAPLRGPFYRPPLVAAGRRIRRSGIARAPTSASARAKSLAPPIAVKLNGISSEQCDCNPPDVQVAAGPNAIVEAVNTQIAVWRRPSYQLVKQISLGAFFSTSAVNRRSNDMTDPRIVFDARSGRWFAAADDFTRSETIIAVSDTNDPAGSWYSYAFSSRGCVDQPRLGVSDSLVAFTGEFFTGACSHQGGHLDHTEIDVINKQELLSRATVHRGRFVNATAGGITPALELSPSSALYMISVQSPTATVAKLHIATSATQSSLPVVNLPIRRIGDPPKAPQSSSSRQIDANDDRVQNVVWENGTLWFAAGDRCVNLAGRALWLSCGRIVTVSTANNHVLEDRSLRLANGRSLFYPAIFPDASGVVLVAFGYSSPSDYPGFGVLAKPLNGAFTSYTVIAQGTGPHTGDRFGDYFGAARDPLDPSYIWIAGEYGRGSDNWGTTIAAVKAGATAPPSAGDVQPPDVRALASGGRPSTKVHLRYMVADNSGRTREAIDVFRGARRIGHTSTDLGQSDGGPYYVPWRAPRNPASLRFCVTSWDPTGNKAGPSCAALRIR